MQYRDELLKEKKRNRSGQKIITFYAFSDMSSSSRQQCKVMLLKDICLSHDFASSIKSCRGNFNPCKLYVNKTDFFFNIFLFQGTTCMSSSLTPAQLEQVAWAHTVVGFNIFTDGDFIALLENLFDHKKHFPIFRHNFLYVILCLLSPVLLLVVTEKSVAPSSLLSSLNIFMC